MRGVGLPEAVARFREEYRDREIPAGYDGRLHLAFTFGVGSIALVLCLLQLQAVLPLEWLAVPLTWLYANLAEYRRHAGQHHRFFNHQAMPLDDLRDLRAVLFPPLLVIFFFGLFALPVWVGLSLLLSDNVAWLFVSTGLGYFLNYEILHLAYHLPDDHWLPHRWLVRKLGWLHRTHHDPRRMAHNNFNITYPVCDLLFSTLRRDPEDKPSADAGDNARDNPPA